MVRNYSTMNHQNKLLEPIVAPAPEKPLMEFVGNNPVLDFHNTLAWPTREGVNDRIRNFDDLAQWSRTSGIITKEEAARLLRRVGKHPKRGVKAVAEARRLRWLLHNALGALAAGERIAVADLDELNYALKRAFKSLQLSASPSGMIWVSDPTAGPAMIVHRLAWETAQLLTSPNLARLRSCANRECGWLFLDTSKNHSRRWCSMGDCGSRAKARRYYRRKKSVKVFPENSSNPSADNSSASDTSHSHLEGETSA